MRTRRKPLLVVAAGGTGGHMFPAQALAEVALERNWSVQLWTDSRGLRFVSGFPPEVETHLIASGTIGRGSVLERTAAPIKLATGIFFAVIRSFRDMPTAYVGFGGYPAFPAMAAAWLLRRPRSIHEQNSVLGRANRFWARRVDVVATGFSLKENNRVLKSTTVGNPLRSSVLEQVEIGYRSPREGSISILAIGGSQGAAIFSKVLPEAVRHLPDELLSRLSIALQTRKGEESAAQANMNRAGVESVVSCFFDDIPERIAEAQLVISRAGASSLSEISAIGRPSILVPYAAAANDHQTSNATSLVEEGAAVLIAESELSSERLAREIEAILTNAPLAEKMAEAARQCGKPNAAMDLANLVLPATDSERSS
ncbi:MAG: UDP-N-acetylglucosamine--N-acetylmuramyl-(pentapeptide) pyrophosphoryl-undecaprenol N-acetylglucosamine transferase [Albidovulum sp.]|nr:UDP-N-acetylglucosamine--N-acetylmuramyl-(pentapeptide) pyrophosphoryl-undecaprenol N-acetylglucosamine transferase [Albidovulum sp.]